MQLSVIELSNALGAEYLGEDVVVTGVSTDTRTILPDNLFVALVGPNFDGHTFVDVAKSKKAAAVLVSHEIPGLGIPQIIVPDTMEALGVIAAQWRASFPIPVIGVTGSSGKTTVKNMIASILMAEADWDASKVIATEGNLNNHIGLPLSILNLDVHHDCAVLEMGMNKLGEIAYLSHIAKPNVSVITNAGPCHLEGVGGSIAGVAQAKGEIFDGLAPDGTAVLNRDDEFFSYWMGKIGTRPYITFGMTDNADVHADKIVSQPLFQQFNLVTHVGEIEINLPLLGEHNVMNALAAASACIAVGVDLDSIKKGLEVVSSSEGRMQTHQLPSGAVVIDDAYNANPKSTRAAIDYLAEMPGTKVLAFADMKELGEQELQYHREIGEYAKKQGVDYLFAYGELAEEAVKAFGASAKICPDKMAIIGELDSLLKKQDTTVLVKASNSMGMQKLVAQILENAKTSV